MARPCRVTIARASLRSIEREVLKDALCPAFVSAPEGAAFLS